MLITAQVYKYIPDDSRRKYNIYSEEFGTILMKKDSLFLVLEKLRNFVFLILYEERTYTIFVDPESRMSAFLFPYSVEQ